MVKKRRDQALNKKRKVKKLRARDSLYEHALKSQKKTFIVAVKENSLLKIIRRRTNQVIYTSVVHKEHIIHN